MPSSRALDALLRVLAAGERPTATQLTAFSDLDHEDGERVRDAWPALPPAVREDVLARATELSEDNVDLNFSALARIALDDDAPAVRRRAIAALWEDRERPTARRLRELLHDADASVRAAAATGLAPFVLDRELGAFSQSEGDAVVVALRQAASEAEESADVRARALEALAPRSLPWVDTLITDAYYADDRRLRLAAIRAMGDSAHDRWIEYLEEQTQSDEPEFRYEAAGALGAIGSEDGIDPLTDLLADDDREVVIAALGALGEIGGDEAIERLRDFQQDAEPALAEIAGTAIDGALALGDQDLVRQSVGDGA